jgi:hypothetical protein
VKEKGRMKKGKTRSENAIRLVIEDEHEYDTKIWKDPLCLCASAMNPLPYFVSRWTASPEKA